jgi:hypothetical protein
VNLGKLKILVIGPANQADNYEVEMLEIMGRQLQRNLRQLVLNKGAEQFIFRYEAGSEDLLLDALVAQARDGRSGFDWFDAAVLSFKLTQSLINEADRLLNEQAPQMTEPFGKQD